MQKIIEGTGMIFQYNKLPVKSEVVAQKLKKLQKLRNNEGRNTMGKHIVKGLMTEKINARILNKW